MIVVNLLFGEVKYDALLRALCESEKAERRGK